MGRAVIIGRIWHMTSYPLIVAGKSIKPGDPIRVILFAVIKPTMTLGGDVCIIGRLVFNANIRLTLIINTGLTELQVTYGD